jgi:predicted RNase H-like HicB family nuclease
MKDLMLRNDYTAVIQEEEGWFIARCPEMPGVTGQGPSAEEARKGLTEAIAMVLEDELSLVADELADELFENILSAKGGEGTVH